MANRYPRCPEELTRKKKPKKPPARRGYDEGWRDRLDAEQTGEELNQLIYPEESDDSPRSRMPWDINQRQEVFNTAQSELQGNLFIPYYHLPPKRARFIDMTDTRTINAGASATVIASTSIDLEHAVLRWFGNELTVTTGYPDVTWTINYNGVAYGPWDAVTLSLGAVASPSLIFIVLTLGDTFSVTAANNSGATNYVVRTRIKGWKW